MKKTIINTLFVACAALQISTASAQLQLPQPSPKASVMQTVGLTDMTIDYSSPGVKGRNIWGDVVPFDKVWRAGANSATKITFSKDVMIENIAVPKGSYSVFMIPTKGEWMIILNKNATASTDEYKQDMDIVRIKATPSEASNHERLVYWFSDFNEEMTVISMAWEKMMISFKVKVATDKQAVESIDKTLGGTWNMYNNAARYYYDKKEYDKALGYVNQSISLSDQWFNNWVKAQILAGKGMNKEAYEHAAKAKEMGDKNPDGFFFKTQVEKALVDWAAFAPKKKK
jgi:hypothetical protein